MKPELLTPAAILAQSILKSVEGQHDELSIDVVAAAFRAAYEAIEKAEKDHSKAHQPSVRIL